MAWIKIALCVPAGVLSCLLSGGCGSNPAPGGSLSAPATIQGQVHGGQQPVTGASIQLFAAGTAGYGTGAVSLLNRPVSTDASGSFSITGDYTCPSSSSQLYLVATGGNPGLAAGTNNTALALMAALGPCELINSQYTLDPARFISIDEVTTVAAVYALSGFMDPGTTQVGASIGNVSGIANAFATVNNLVNTSAGTALATTPAGNGVVPQAEIDTLANILSPCVNSAGTGAPCSALFSAATPANGTVPTNTLQAALSIATHPASQVAALYAITSSTAPYQPQLSSAPNDWTVAATFTGGGLLNPTGLAIDGLGNVWFPNNGSAPNTSSVTELSNMGAPLSGTTGYTGGGQSFDSGIAIDPLGNVWVSGYGNNGEVVKLSSSGSILSGPSGYTSPGLNFVRTLGIDGHGNVWVPNSGGISTPGVFEFASDGSLLSPLTGYTDPSMNGPYSVAFDTAGNAWVANVDFGNITELSSSGAVLSGPSGFTGGGIGLDPEAIAFDAGGNAWIGGTNGVVAELTSSGTPVSPSSGYPLCVPSNPAPSVSVMCQIILDGSLAIDGSGNVWSGASYFIQDRRVNPPAFTISTAVVELNNSGAIVSGNTGYQLGSAAPGFLAVDSSGNVWTVTPSAAVGLTKVIELIGAATPVVTPLSVGVRDGTLGKRP